MSINTLSKALILFLSTTGFAHAALLTGDDSYGIPVSRVLTVEAPGVLDNDTLDGQPAGDAGVTAVLLTDVSKGTLACPDVGPGLCADGSFEYTPGTAFDGTDSFTYQAVSTGETSPPTTVTITACTGGPQTYTCWLEASYLNKLAELGYSAFVESFEGVAWDVARSPVTAPSIESKGITWTTNHPVTNGITTGSGPARTGVWGVYDPNHGYGTGTIAECDVVNPPAHCFMHDGFSGSTPGPDVLFAVGAYISGSFGANVDIIIDGIPHNAGALSGSGHQFMGVVDTAGFNTFEFRELEGKLEQQLFIFGDDFTIATSAPVPVNNAPVLATIGDQTADENVQLIVALSASDADDGDNLSYSVSGLPAGASFFDNGDGTADFFWQPDYSQAGSYPVTFTVSDNAVPAATDSETITITVNDVNRPPVLSSIGNRSVDEDALLTIALTATDPDGHVLSFSNTPEPPGSSLVDNGDGTATFSWTPAIGQAGDYPVTFTVTDNGVPAANDSEPIIITVIDTTVPVNNAPVADAGIDQTALPGDTVTLDGSGSFDLDGDALTYSWSLSKPAGSAAVLSNSASVNPSFTVDLPGTYTAELVVNDALVNSAPDSVNINTPGRLQLSSPAYMIAENGTTAIITVTRTGGSYGTIGVSYSTSSGSATAGSDYTAASGTLSLADGVLSGSFDVAILDDTAYEGDETVNLLLSNPTGGAGLGTPSSAVLTIAEDDPVPPAGSLQFSAPTFTVAENGAVAMITVTRVNGSFGSVSVDYFSNDGSATDGADFTAVSGSLTFADGELTRTFDVPIFDDIDYEGDETVNLSLGFPTGGASIGSPSTAVLTITEDDPVPPAGSLQFSAPAYSVAENGTTATITVTRINGSFGTVGVDYVSSDGTASAGSDYTPVNGSLTFADGVTVQTFAIDIFDDVDYEGDETVALALSNPTGGAGLNSPSTAILTIAEDDPVPPSGSLQFSAVSYSVAENGVSATITVSRVGGSFGTVGVDYASNDVTATAGVDYNAVIGTLSFADGVTSQSFAIPVLDDSVYEGEEKLKIVLSNPTGGAGLGVPSSSTLLITEDDPVPPAGSLQFSQGAYSVTEDGAVAAITVTRVGGSFGTVGVDYASSDDVATAGRDYTAVSGSLSFADGVTSQVFTITILDDVDYEGDEMLLLSLANPTGGAGLGSPAVAALTIAEDDPIPPAGSLQFSDAAYQVDEARRTAKITVVRVGGSFGTVTVDYASNDGSAVAGRDYVAVSDTLSFGDGVTSQNFKIELLGDRVYEGDEVLNLVLSKPTGGAGLGSPSSASLRIIEDDARITEASAGGSSGGSLDLMTLILLLGWFLRSAGIRTDRVRSDLKSIT